MRKLLHKIGIHFYSFRFNEGANNYFECPVCGRRKASPVSVNVVGPVNWDWVNAGKGNKLPTYESPPSPPVRSWPPNENDLPPDVMPVWKHDLIMKLMGNQIITEGMTPLAKKHWLGYNEGLREACKIIKEFKS